MTTLEQISADLKNITPADMYRLEAHLDPPGEGEEVLGLAGEYSKRLWALAHDYHRLSDTAAHAAAFEAADEIEIRSYHASARRYQDFAEVTRSLAWMEMRTESKSWPVVSVSIRRGFVIVAAKCKSDDTPEAIFGGAIPLPDELAKAVLEMMNLRKSKKGVTPSKVH